MINITECTETKYLNRLEVLNNYLMAAKLKPHENKLYIEDLEASIEWEKKTPTKNYTQECHTWIIPQGLDKKR
jgi:hypothetical protein